jgi:hypothetical protein
MKLEFIRHIFEKYQISNFTKIPLMGAELFYAGGREGGRAGGWTDGRTERRTDMKLILAFRNFAEAHKNQPTLLLCSSITKKNSFSKYYNSIYYSAANLIRNVTNESLSNKSKLLKPFFRFNETLLRTPYVHLQYPGFSAKHQLGNTALGTCRDAAII